MMLQMMGFQVQQYGSYLSNTQEILTVYRPPGIISSALVFPTSVLSLQWCKREALNTVRS